MKIRYVGPFDEIEIPDLGVAAKHGHLIDVEVPEVAAGLLEQTTNFEPADDEAQALVKRIEADRARAEQEERGEVVDDGLEKLTIPQLEEQAKAEPGGPVDLAGKTKKADLIAAIRTHRENEGA